MSISKDNPNIRTPAISLQGYKNRKQKQFDHKMQTAFYAGVRALQEYGCGWIAYHTAIDTPAGHWLERKGFADDLAERLRFVSEWVGEE